MEETKRALVTGGSGGIGQGIALVLAEQGWDVAITYHVREQGAMETKAQIEALGRRCWVYQSSLEDPEEPQRVVDAAHADMGRIDGFVCNAGRDGRHSILTATYEDLKRIVDTNFFGYMLLTGAVARHMVKDGVKGSIVFITSIRGEVAHPDDFIYGGIKAAVNRASKSLAMELSLYGIRVNCIAPGATDIGRNHVPESAHGTEINGRTFYHLSKIVPLDRMGTPRDNGELAAFLLSDKASYITGDVIRVDGGLVLPAQPEGYAPSYWINRDWAKKQYDQVMEEEPK